MYQYAFTPPSNPSITIPGELVTELTKFMAANPDRAEIIQQKVSAAIRDIIDNEKYEKTIRDFWQGRQSRQ